MGPRYYGCLIYGKGNQDLPVFKSVPVKSNIIESLGEEEREGGELCLDGPSKAFIQIYTFPKESPIIKSNVNAFIVAKKYTKLKTLCINYDWRGWDFEPPLNYVNYSTWVNNTFVPNDYKIPCDMRAVWKLSHKLKNNCDRIDYEFYDITPKSNVWIRNISPLAYKHYVESKMLTDEISNYELAFVATNLNIPLEGLTRNKVYTDILEILKVKYDL